MSFTNTLVPYAAALTFLAPLFGLFLLSFVGFSSLKSNERLVTRLVAAVQTVAFLSAFFLAIWMTIQYFDTGAFPIVHAFHHHLFSFGHHHVEFTLQLDGVSVWFVLMATTLSNIVGVFSQHYLHRDPGFFRFFFLILLFLTGVLILFMATTFQIVFIGWELMGITSALLISFFTIRRETIDNALHAFWAYRVSDIGLLCGSIALASLIPGYQFLCSDSRALPGVAAFVVPALFLVSAMGKSAQFPYSSWLPRAMEGPTSSSAIFYGGLSIHAGVYLLLRTRIEFEIPLLILIAIGVVGAVSCLYGALLSQVQSDVKSALAYASLSQVGVMFIEVAIGWNTVVVVHCLGHAFLRTYQILKCSSIIHQFVEFEDAHRYNIEQAKASLTSVILAPQRMNRLFSIAFDLALRAASGPSFLVVKLEALSSFLQRSEERLLSAISGVVVDERDGR